MSLELLEGLGRKVVPHDKVEWRAGDHANRVELARVIFDAAVDGRRSRMAAEAADGQGVAIWVGLRTARAANGAAGAADIFDDHALTERARHVVGDKASKHVRGATRREHHQHRDRFCRKCLSQCM